MNMVIFGILQPSIATLQLKKSQINGTERPMRKNLHELLSQSNVYTHCSVNPNVAAQHTAPNQLGIPGYGCICACALI